MRYQIRSNEDIKNLRSNIKEIVQISDKINFRQIPESEGGGEFFKSFVNHIKNTKLSAAILNLNFEPDDANDQYFFSWSAYENFILAGQLKGINDVQDNIIAFAANVSRIAQRINRESKNIKKSASFLNLETALKIFETGIREEIEIADKSLSKLEEYFEDSQTKLLINNGYERDFHASRAVNAEKDLAVLSSRKNNEIQQIKSEINVSGLWEKFFEERVKEIRREIRNIKKANKIFCIRGFMYAVPVIAFALALCFMFCDAIDGKRDMLFELALASILLTSILSYHLKQSLRELNTLNHMNDSYRHRAIVAKTLKELVVSGHFGVDNKQTVVEEAARAMFKRESVGYLSKDQMEPSNTPVQEVTKIFK